MGSGIDQLPATEMTHLGLNQPPVFFSSDTFQKHTIQPIYYNDTVHGLLG